MQRLSRFHWRAVDPVACAVELVKCWGAGLAGAIPGKARPIEGSRNAATGASPTMRFRRRDN